MKQWQKESHNCHHLCRSIIITSGSQGATNSREIEHRKRRSLISRETKHTLEAASVSLPFCINIQEEVTTMRRERESILSYEDHSLPETRKVMQSMFSHSFRSWFLSEQKVVDCSWVLLCLERFLFIFILSFTSSRPVMNVCLCSFSHLLLFV